MEMKMENTFDELEASIEKTGGRLEDIATNLTKCDQFSEAMVGDSETEVVEGLLQTVKQVQTDYETFRGDLLELRELQKQIRCELQMSAHELQNRLLSLRLRMQSTQSISNTELDDAYAYLH